MSVESSEFLDNHRCLENVTESSQSESPKSAEPESNETCMFRELFQEMFYCVQGRMLLSAREHTGLGRLRKASAASRKF